MAIKIKKTGELNTYTIVVSGKDAAKTPYEAQIIFDALDTLLADNTGKVQAEIKLMKNGKF